MKKTSAFLLSLALTFSLAACGGDTADKSSSAGSQTASAEKETEKKEEKKNEITFTEMTVVDNDQCSIKLLELDPKNMWGYTVKAELENKSADKTYMFAVDSASVNGVMDDPLFADEVAGGKKSREDISFPMDTLKDNGITEVTDIEVTFRVYDSDDWSVDPVAKETVHIYPYGEDKAQNFVREDQSSDNVVIDNDNVKVIVTGYDPDGLWGYTVHLFLVNKSDKIVMFSVDDASVNGYMADPFYATTVNPGKCAFSDMSWSDTELENNGITDVETIEFNLRAYDDENWMGDDLANETITLTPNN